MPITNEFDNNLRKTIADSIPCIHMNGIMMSEKVLRTFKKYLEDLKTSGKTTIDQVLEDMENKDGK